MDRTLNRSSVTVQENLDPSRQASCRRSSGNLERRPKMSRAMKSDEQVTRSSLCDGKFISTEKVEGKRSSNIENKKDSKRNRRFNIKDNNRCKDFKSENQQDSRQETSVQKQDTRQKDLLKKEVTQDKKGNFKMSDAVQNKRDMLPLVLAHDGNIARRIDKLLAKARKALDKRQRSPVKEISNGKRNQQELQVISHVDNHVTAAAAGEHKNAVKQTAIFEAWSSPSPGADIMEDKDPLFIRRRSLDSLNDSRTSSRIIFRQERLGSTVSSLDQTMTRSLGSRGSLCDEAADDCDNINVVVRCRPLNEKERLRGDESNVTFPGEGQAWVNMDGVNGQATQKPKVFSYNVVFEPEATQEDVLEHSGVKRVLDMAIDGFSCTVFCYGQTGSGKTHTLTGPPHLFDKGPDMFSESHGLIFRSFVYLFNQLQSRDDQEFTLTASYLEIYNEKVIDLLNMGTNNKPLQVRWSKKKRGFFVENLFEIECAELDDLLAVLEEGLRNRAVASHNMNEYSSRSHTILSVNITSEQKADDGVYVTRNGKINFVDLAGSEMTKKTNSEGKTLEEANNINKSLMVLGTCIAALSDSRKRDSHIPYRDSKLTKLLADSLAGNGVTLMIACVSPAKSNISETLNTLRYASRAKRIRTKPIIVMDPKEKVIMSLQREVSLLREENAHLKMLIDLGENGLPREGDHAGVRGGGGALPSLSAAGANIPGPVSDAVTQPMSRQGSFRIDNEKLENLDNRELIRLVQHYMAEHENVRMENKELQEIATSLVRDQELVCKENERLLRQLEVVNSGGGQPPPGEEDLVGSTQPFSRGSTKSSKTASFRSRSLPSSSSSDVWINPLNDTSAKESGSAPSSRGRESTSQSSQRSNRLPDSINKELEKRRIGKSMTDLSASGGGGGGNSGGKQATDGKTDAGVILTRRAPMKSKNLSPAGVVAGKSRSLLPRLLAPLRS